MKAMKAAKDSKFDVDADDSDMDVDGEQPNGSEDHDVDDDDIRRDKNTALWFKKNEHLLSEAPYFRDHMVEYFCYMFVYLYHACVCTVCFHSTFHTQFVHVNYVA